MPAAVESTVTLVLGMDPVIASLVIAVVSLVVAVYLMSWVMKLPSDVPAMQKIADAIKQGAARALCELSPENRKPLKTEGHLSRDPRAKERRKYGLKKARKAPQFSKR